MNEGGSKTTSDAKSYVIGIDFADPSIPSYTFVNDINTGMFRSSGDVWFESHVDDIYDLFFAGKTIKDNVDEYMDVIMRLPTVNKNQLDAIEVLEFFRQRMFPESDEK